MLQELQYGIPVGREAFGWDDLVIAAQNGDRAAFQELVGSYDAAVMQIALTLTRSERDAQEIYCRVFVDAFRSLYQLRPGSSVFLWVYRILARHCVSYCRNNSGVIGVELPDADFARHVRDAFAVLPPRERVILLLKHSGRLKIGTLAEIFSTTPEAIAKMLRNATRHLRERSSAAVRAGFRESGSDGSVADQQLR